MGSENSDDGLTTVISETFDVGATEVCFPFNFTVSDETVDTKRLKLTIMNGTNMTEVENGSGSMVINIVDKESRKLICRNYCCAKPTQYKYLVYTQYIQFAVSSIPPTHTHLFLSACPTAFLFPETAVNSQAEFPCSFLDDSFLSGGVITAQCSANNTWDALDMSQCTFRNDVHVSIIAIVEVPTRSHMQEETIEVCHYQRTSPSMLAVHPFNYVQTRLLHPSSSKSMS